MQVDDKAFDKIQAVISSMTPEERAHPDMINGSRRRRIAMGSGTTVQEVNRLLKQFDDIQKMMKKMSKGNARRALRGFPIPQ